MARSKHSGSNVAAFDLDNARDPATGSIALEAMGYVGRAASYTEISVSGTGLHVIGTGSGDKVHKKQKVLGSDVEVESYRGAERYIVVTGKPLPETWPHMASIDGVIDAERIHDADGSAAKDWHGGGSRFASWEDAKAFVENLKETWIQPGFIKDTRVRRVEEPPNVFLDQNTKQAVPFAERDEANTLDSDGRAA